MIRRTVDALGGLDSISLFLCVIAGVGCLAFVAFSWGVHFVSSGHYFAAGALAVASMVVSCAAVAQIPLALLVFLGGAVAVGTAFSIGASRLVMP